jgi:predicted  nucleic acid-binding Zn-ribbon protein
MTKIKQTLTKEQDLWKKIENLRREMVQIATEKQLNFLHPEVLEASQTLNALLVEYEKLLHKQTK